MLEIMKFVRWQYSCARVFISRSSESITFSASSIVAWWREVCRCCCCCCCSVSVDDDDDVGEGLDLSISRFQFALPAVEFSFLLQIIFTPPVASASFWISPPVTLSSSSLKKDSASATFRSSNSFFFFASAFLASAAAARAFVGLLAFVGLAPPFFGEVFKGVSSSSSSPRSVSIRRRNGVCSFLGEYWSFQSLITS